MRADLTDITILLDRSGSMEQIKADTIGGVNAFLREQRNGPGKARVTLAQFDNVYEAVYEARPIAEAPGLDANNFQPRGSTALLDALCRLIDDTGRRLEKEPTDRRPGLVIFVIVTDGHENSSHLHTIDQVNERITRQRDTYKWHFVYLGANQDAIAEAAKMGMRGAAAATYSTTPGAIKSVYVQMANNVTRARGMSAGGASIGASVLDWDEAQLKDMNPEAPKEK